MMPNRGKYKKKTSPSYIVKNPVNCYWFTYLQKHPPVTMFIQDFFHENFNDSDSSQHYKNHKRSILDTVRARERKLYSVKYFLQFRYTKCKTLMEKNLPGKNSLPWRLRRIRFKLRFMSFYYYFLSGALLICVGYVCPGLFL